MHAGCGADSSGWYQAAQLDDVALRLVKPEAAQPAYSAFLSGMQPGHMH